MANEQLANFAVSQLNGAINDIVTSLVVDDGSVFPSAGNFRLKIDSEILICTSRSGNTLTVSRGAESTTAASHSDNTRVSGILTKGSLEQLFKDRVIYDTFANRPAAGLEGRLFLGSNTIIRSYDNGSLWKSDVFGYPITEINNGDFSWVNQGSAAVDITRGYLDFSIPTSVADDIRCRVKSEPASTYIITVLFNFVGVQTNFDLAGIGWRESSSGKLITFWANQNGTTEVVKFTNPTTFSAVYVNTNYRTYFTPLVCLRIERTATERVCSISHDGYNFLEVHRVGDTDFMDPDQVMMCMNSVSSQPIRAAYYSWDE